MEDLNCSCGGKVKLLNDDYDFWVECETCQRRTAEYSTGELAIKMWDSCFNANEKTEALEKISNTAYCADIGCDQDAEGEDCRRCLRNVALKALGRN